MSPGEETRPTRFAILGGYLGAGKTTLAVSVARELCMNRGRSVAIITNDQGNVLVDTEFVRDAGFDVRDVIGGCFCTNFSEFVRSADSLVQTGRPDLIIAEPIGTSTNIISSVVAPLKTMYPEKFDVAPLFIVLDGTRAADLLSREAESGLLGKRIIPHHQLREAECVLVSRADQIGREEMSSIVERIGAEVPEAEVIPYSAVDGTNVERTADLMISDRTSAKNSMPVDPALFAMEKASLGWYNASATIIHEGKLDAYAFALSVVKGLSSSFDAEDIGHVKLIISSPAGAMKMSLIMSTLRVDGVRGGKTNGRGYEDSAQCSDRRLPEGPQGDIRLGAQERFRGRGSANGELRGSVLHSEGAGSEASDEGLSLYPTRAEALPGGSLLQTETPEDL